MSTKLFRTIALVGCFFIKINKSVERNLLRGRDTLITERSKIDEKLRLLKEAKNIYGGGKSIDNLENSSDKKIEDELNKLIMCCNYIASNDKKSYSTRQLQKISLKPCQNKFMCYKNYFTKNKLYQAGGGVFFFPKYTIEKGSKLSDLAQKVVADFNSKLLMPIKKNQISFYNQNGEKLSKRKSIPKEYHIVYYSLRDYLDKVKKKYVMVTFSPLESFSEEFVLQYHSSKQTEFNLPYGKKDSLLKAKKDLIKHMPCTINSKYLCLYNKKDKLLNDKDTLSMIKNACESPKFITMDIYYRILYYPELHQVPTSPKMTKQLLTSKKKRPGDLIIEYCINMNNIDEVGTLKKNLERFYLIFGMARIYLSTSQFENFWRKA